MYDNVIVPFDGTLPGRAVLAPAGDLAWRCGARVVIVSKSDADDQTSRSMLKTRAMSMSGSDVDFWVDLGHDLGAAVVEAARSRPSPVVTLPVRARPTGLRRFRSMGPVPTRVLLDSPVPVLTIGPETDVSRGLPMTELVVYLDGSPECEAIVPLAVEWSRGLKLDLVLVGVVRRGGWAADPSSAEQAYLDEQRAALAEHVPASSTRLIETDNPTRGLCAFLADRESAVLAMSTHGQGGLNDNPLGPVSQGVLLGSPRAVLFARPDLRV